MMYGRERGVGVCLRWAGQEGIYCPTDEFGVDAPQTGFTFLG